MKTKHSFFAASLAAILFTFPCAAETQAPKIAVVNFKTCIEKSKSGKQEQTNFDNMKKQMEDVLTEKEKVLKELSKKFEDDDYLDSLSQEAQAELKHKSRNLTQEFGQHQQQFYQVLQQANFKIIQKLTEEIGDAAKMVAKAKNIDIIVNEEGTFYYNPSLDISEDVVKAMDEKSSKNETK